MTRFRPYPVAAFAATTLFIWGNRVWLAWTDPDLDVADKLVYSVPITAFVAAAIVVLVLQLRRRQATPSFSTLVAVFAAGTVAYWGIRLPVLLLHDHSVPFKVVHSLLAAVSAGTAVAAWRSRSSATAGAGSTTARRPVDLASPR